MGFVIFEFILWPSPDFNRVYPVSSECISISECCRTEECRDILLIHTKNIPFSIQLRGVPAKAHFDLNGISSVHEVKHVHKCLQGFGYSVHSLSQFVVSWNYSKYLI